MQKEINFYQEMASEHRYKKMTDVRFPFIEEKRILCMNYKK